MPRRTGEPADRRTGIRRILAVVRRIWGMPDYPGYVEHLRRCHPGCPVPTEREFFDQYVKARSDGGPVRCC